MVFCTNIFHIGGQDLFSTFITTYNIESAFTIADWKDWLIHMYFVHIIFKVLDKDTEKTKMLVRCQRFRDLFLFGLVLQYSTNQKQYDKGRFEVMATYL